MKFLIIGETVEENEALHENIFYFLLKFSVNLKLAWKIKSLNKQKRE